MPNATPGTTRHNVRDATGRFTPAPKLDPRFRPHHPIQITQIAEANPGAPPTREAAPDISPTVPYTGDSPTGYDPYTTGTF